jgi:hypothetical protein
VPHDRSVQAATYPSLYYTQAELDVLETLTTLPSHSAIWNDIQAWANAHVNDPVPAYNDSQVHKLVNRYLDTMVFMYHMTDDTAYKDAAVRWMLGVANWSSWHNATGTNHWQSTSYIQFGMANGYYSLKDEISSADRSTILAALTSIDKGGYEVDRYGGSLSSPTFGYSYFPSGFPNHESTVGAATGIAALAMGGDYSYSDAWLAFANASIERALSFGGGTDGSWLEGPSYFNFSMCSLAIYADVYKRFGGTDYASVYSDFLADVSMYAWYMTVTHAGTQAKVQMEDATGNQLWNTNGEPVWAYFLARTFNDSYAQEFADTYAASDYPLSYIWKDPNVSIGDHTDLPSVREFDDIGYLIARDSWDDSSATLVLFKSGRSRGHAHPNQNTFMIYKNGTPLTGGLGYLNTYTEYQTSVLNNCISVGDLMGNDGRLYGYGQAREPGDIGMATVPEGTSADLTDVASTAVYLHATGDASALYTGEINPEPGAWPWNSSGDADSVLRQLVWIPGENYIVIYDQVDLPVEQPVHFKVNALDIYNQVSGDTPPLFSYNAGSDTFIDSFGSNQLEVRPVIPSTADTSYYTGDYSGPSGREFSLLTISSMNGTEPRLVTVLTPGDALSTAQIDTTAVRQNNSIGVIVDSASYKDLILFSSDGTPVSEWIELGGNYQSADGNVYSFNGTQVLADFSSYKVMRLEVYTGANQPPVLDAIGDKSVDEGQSLEFTVSASDPEGDNLTYSASNLPSGASFNPGTQTFSWTPGTGQAGTYSDVHFEVSDGEFVDSENITITVTSYTPPTISFIPPTDADGTTVSRDWTEINTSINSTSDTSGFIDWNRTLVGYWDFNANTNDNSTYSNNGTLHGAQLETGKFDNAARFVINGDYFLINDSASMDFDKSTGTIEMWLYPFDKASGNRQRLVIDSSFWDPGTDPGIELALQPGGNLYFYPVGAGGTNYNLVTDPLNNNEWQHLAVTWNYSTKEVLIYINGVRQSFATENVPSNWNTIAQTGDWYVGGTDVATGLGFFDGMVDELRVWNRPLSEQEIEASYNATLYNLTYTATNLTDGAYQYYASVTDTRGNSAQTETRTLTVDSTQPNQPPVLDPISNKSVNEGELLEFTISASDPEGDNLTYSASNLPSGASFNGGTQTFSWVPSLDQAGTYPDIQFIVSDSGSLSDSENITITVNPSIADLNNDGVVNILDLILIAQHWGETGANGWIPEDVNSDGTINILDINVVAQRWTA